MHNQYSNAQSLEHRYGYLSDITGSFIKMLERKYGDGWSKELALIGRPYMFIQFDLEIEKKRKQYLSGGADPHLKILKNELHDIQNIMVKNIQSVLDREANLESCSQRSGRLADKSKKYAWNAKKLNYREQLKKWAPVIGCVSVCGFVFMYKFVYFFS